MPLPKVFTVKNARLWNSQGEHKNVELRVEEGTLTKIASAGTYPPSKEDFDALGMVILPAGVDLQVHLRVPGQSEKETALTGLRAALRGGYGAVVSMPNTRPTIDNVDVLKRAQGEVRAAEAQTGVKAYFSVAMTLGQEGVEPVGHARALREAGAVALTDDGKGVAQDAVMERLYAVAIESDLPLLQHAEVPGHGTALAEGPTQKKLGLKAYPLSAEIDMVARDLKLLAKYPQARYHVLHVSAKETLDLVQIAKKHGLRVTCEVTPHHLFFSSEDIPEKNTDFKMNPPLRGPEHQGALRAALARGDIDFVSTDHAPHEKSKKGEDFTASAFGTTGLETALRTLLSLYQKGELGPQRLVEVFALRAAEFLGITPEFGDLQEGAPFRAVWVDVDAAPRKLELSELESLSKNNCFLGAELAGRVLGSFNSSGLFRF